jgi:hypothetical protein
MNQPEAANTLSAAAEDLDARCSPPLEPPDSVLELCLTAERHEASFPQVIKAMWLGRPDWRPPLPPNVTAMYASLYPRLLQGFVRTHGPIDASYYSDDLPAGVVLNRAPCDDGAATASSAISRWRSRGWRGGPVRRQTGQRDGRRQLGCEPQLVSDLHAIVWWEQLCFDSHEARTLFADLMLLRDRVTGFLPAIERQDGAHLERHRLLREIYCIVCDLVASVSRESRDHKGKEWTPSARHRRELADLQPRLTTARANYDASSKRIGERWFLPGVWLGMAVATVILATLGVITLWKDIDAAWLATAGAGMIGAVLSVLQRMTSGSLAVSAEAHRSVVQKVGFFRPLVGLMLGMISYVLLAGGLVSLRPPNASATAALFFAGIAFLAGFSERFARDVLAAPTRLIPSTKPDQAAKTHMPKGATPQM